MSYILALLVLFVVIVLPALIVIALVGKPENRRRRGASVPAEAIEPRQGGH